LRALLQTPKKGRADLAPPFPIDQLSLWRQSDLFFLIKEKTSGSIHLLQFLFTGLFFFFMVLFSFLVWFSCLKISVVLFHPCTQRQNISLRSVKQSAERLIIDRNKRIMIRDNAYRSYRSLSYDYFFYKAVKYYRDGTPTPASDKHREPFHRLS
jgi:hypothetical protein